MLKEFFDKWLTRRACWKADARRLIAFDRRTAFHAAQVEIARARHSGDRSEAWHWAKVAAEVARICLQADLDVERSVEAIRKAGFDYW